MDALSERPSGDGIMKADAAPRHTRHRVAIAEAWMEAIWFALQGSPALICGNHRDLLSRDIFFSSMRGPTRLLVRPRFLVSQPAHLKGLVL